MGRDNLGEFEHRVMLALLRLGEGAYSAPILTELEARTGRSVRSAAVYIALRRLEEKGLVASRMVPPGEEGGRDRRHFRVSAEGRRRLREARSALESLWEGLDSGYEEAR